MSKQSEPIEQTIFLVRDQRVMIDTDLATLYGVPVKALVQAVKRNVDRFPADFAFQLSYQEVRALKSQSVTSKSESSEITTEFRGGNRKLPWVFTEQGIAMLSSVLRSPRAVATNVQIMRAFVRMRTVLATNQALEKKLSEIERKVGLHDSNFRAVFQAIRQLMTPPEPRKRKIGFLTE